MKILKVFNNNVVLALKDNQEVVVLGLGIGFQKKVNESVDENKVSQFFIKQSINNLNYASELFENFSDQEIQFYDQTYAKLKLVFPSLNNNLYFSLSDHIHNSLVNHEKITNYALQNSLYFYIKTFYKKEYEICQTIIKEIKNNFNVAINDKESISLTLHLISNLNNTDTEAILNVTTIVSEIIKIIRLQAKRLVISEDHIDWQRFKIHLEFLAMFVYRHQNYHETHKNNDQVSQSLLNTLLADHQNISPIFKSILQFLDKAYQYELNTSEQVYLLVHLIKIIGSKGSNDLSVLMSRFLWNHWHRVIKSILKNGNAFAIFRFYHYLNAQIFDSWSRLNNKLSVCIYSGCKSISNRISSCWIILCQLRTFICLSSRS
ncbi:CAT RNA binding domain-containing protein [[Mycoplasma] testudinis]|uniref:CAT RNA binding domain-containing protein n=1 Tax=[Mycoplasma] testudinis TaxID=33924 RepID=UPI00048A13BB|nr:CAT RNA binding domain-containing protein [[Mycoplasma] testudinis]